MLNDHSGKTELNQQQQQQTNIKKNCVLVLVTELKQWRHLGYPLPPPPSPPPPPHPTCPVIHDGYITRNQQRRLNFIEPNRLQINKEICALNHLNHFCHIKVVRCFCMCFLVLKVRPDMSVTVDWALKTSIRFQGKAYSKLFFLQKVPPFSYMEKTSIASIKEKRQKNYFILIFKYSVDFTFSS